VAILGTRRGAVHATPGRLTLQDPCNADLIAFSDFAKTIISETRKRDTRMTNELVKTAAIALLNHLSTMNDDAFERVDTDYIDYSPDAHFTVALFDAIEPAKDRNYFDMITEFTYELASVTKSDDDRADVDRFCTKLFSALLRFEMSENIQSLDAS
jgi:hypothetical protein